MILPLAVMGISLEVEEAFSAREVGRREFPTGTIAGGSKVLVPMTIPSTTVAEGSGTTDAGAASAPFKRA